MQVKLQVETLVAAIKQPYVLECQVGSFPSCWAPQQTNTQLFEVDLKSSQVAELVQTLQQQQLEIVKVPGHCTQDKQNLWSAFMICLMDAHTSRQQPTQTAKTEHCYDTTPSIASFVFYRCKNSEKDLLSWVHCTCQAIDNGHTP